MNIFTRMALVALSAATALTGCIVDGPATKPVPPRSGVPGEMTLTVDVPGAYQSPGKTRALDETDENAVDELHVLTFDGGGQLVDITEARARGGNNYSVALPALAPGAPVTMVALANSGTILALSIGMNAASVTPKDYASVMQSITAAVDGKLFYESGDRRLPMWGETRRFTIPADGSAPAPSEGVTLVRSVARIDIGVGNLTKGEGDMPLGWDGADRNGRPVPFIMTSVYVVRPPDRFSVAPLAANVDPDGSRDGGPAVIASSVPASASPWGVSGSVAELGYTVDGSTPNSIISTIYVPEADIASGGKDRHRQRMALVVGGIFGSDPSAPESFYRVDFSDGTLRDVLRNTLYTFSIREVTGSGKATVEEAYGAQSMNMTVAIEEWSMGYNYNVWFDGSHYFAMSHRDVRFGPMPGGEPVRVDIVTNIGSAQGGFGFFASGNASTASFASVGPTGFQDADDTYEYTLERNTASDAPDDAWILWISNPRHNIDPAGDTEREDVWTVKTLNLKMRFTVGQDYAPGGVISINDRRLSGGEREGAFLTPDGNAASPIAIEIVRLDPIEITATDAATGAPAPWIDLGGTAGLQTPGPGGVYSYRRDVTVGPFPYDPAAPDATERVAVISAFSAATGTNVTYTVTQQAPFIRTAQTTLPVSFPAPDAAEITVPVYITSNIAASHLRVTKSAGGDTGITLADSSGALVSYDPRNSANMRFDVRVARSSGDSHSATFAVATTDALYGPLPALAISVVVPPANQIFRWAPSVPEWSTGGRYVFPWNTTRVSLDVESNVPAEPHTGVMSTADAGLLTAGTPATASGGATLYPFTFDTGAGKTSYTTIDRHTVALRSTVPPFIASLRADFSVGVQVLRMAAGAHGATNTNFDWNGRTAASPATIEMTGNVEWTAASSADWLSLRDGDSGSSFARSVTVDDRLHQPVEDPADDYAANTATRLVQQTPLEFAIAPLDFYVPFDGSQPESRTAIVTVTNNDHDATRSGAADPAPLTITQWNRVLRSEGSSMPAYTVLQPEQMEGATHRFMARTNLNSWRVDFWEANDDGTKKDPANTLHTAFYSGTPTLSASAAPVVVEITGVQLPAPGPMKRNLLVTLSADGLSAAQEQRVGMWTQPSSHPHPDLAFDRKGIPAPPGVLGVGARTGRLTLRGSKEYPNQMAIDAGFPQGVASESVYVVLFKRGSLVGLSTNRQINGYDTREIIWAPAEYNVEAFIEGGGAWAGIPSVGGAYPTTANIAAGTGDPCAFVEGHDSGTAPWKTPTGASSPYPGYFDGPNGMIAAGQNYNVDPNGLIPQVWNNIDGITVNGWAFRSDRSIVVPLVGYRDGTGVYQATNSQNHYFWVNGGGIYINGGAATTQFVVNAPQSATYAMPIRCVPR